MSKQPYLLDISTGVYLNLSINPNKLLEKRQSLTTLVVQGT